MARILSLFAMASVLLAPLAPLACEVLCPMAPDASVPAGCHSEPAADTSITAADPCVEHALADDATFITPHDRLQQRSPIAALRMHLVPEGAAALMPRQHDRHTSLARTPHFVLRV